MDHTEFRNCFVSSGGSCGSLVPMVTAMYVNDRGTEGLIVLGYQCCLSPFNDDLVSVVDGWNTSV